MAVQSATSRIQYAGNNSTTTSYAVPFVFLENSHLQAIARTSAGVESTVTLTNHTGAGDVNGGTVRTSVAVPATSTLTIFREVPATQTTSYQEGGDFPAASHERALDKLTQIAQQNQRQIGAGLRLTEANPIAALPLPTAAGQHVLATAGSGTAPSFQSLGSLAIGPVIATGSTTPRSVQDRFADVVNVKDFGAVANCTDIGIGTDVVPAILAAVNHAVTSIGDGAVVILPQGRYRCSTSCVINLQGKKNITIDLQGLLTADNTSMTVFTIENGEGLILNADLHEGGVFNGWSDAQPFGPCNYSTTRNAAGAGGQEMFLLRGLLNYTVHLRAHGYAGRVLRTDERNNAAHRHTQAIKGWIATRRNYDFSKARTAQSLWADGGTTVPNQGNWGRLDALVADFDYYGPVWVRLNDIEIESIDASYANAGPSFRGCSVINGNTWFIGDTDEGAGSRHIELIPSTVNCAFFNVKFLRFLNKGSGLYADGVTGVATRVYYIGTSSAYSKAVELINCIQASVDVTAFGTGGTLLEISGASTDNINCTVDNLGVTNTEDCVVIAASVTNPISLTPNISVTTASRSGITVAGTSTVFINNPHLVGSASTNIFNFTSNNNQVYISGGRVSGSATVYNGGIAPRSVFNTVGLASAANFIFRTNQGGAAGGNGGEVQFGLNDSSFVQHSPMATIKGSLVNGVGTELQGDLKLQVRPFGSSGQVLQDGFVVSATGNDGETYAKMLTRISGADVEKRIKVGGTGTGPSGVGRALFVDN